MGSDNQKTLGERLPPEHHRSDSNHKPQKIIYDPSLDTFETVDSGNLNGESWSVSAHENAANFIADCDSFTVDLPRWRNRVDIYVGSENRSGFVATVQLDRLGQAKNWQRRLSHKYRILHVKGLKPGTVSRTSSNPSAPISVLKDGDQHG